ncbi:siphovirus ReqiPepy6 Gp37-like family protein [Gottfriedia acidiceleris]|uniref:siphovirus ReqiPepy6 Gp37-like family protein n=1 Tax=Gottfriedia acidiceleris TaxID=371036 RepID=UPI00101CF232|nr:siphovirus ReqiPepy6 Gp37-like family protein [Gottfriedia acidiceleris]
MYELYVRDQYFNRVAVIQDFQSFEAIIRFNAPGTWVLELPTNCEAAKELVKKKSGIVVYKDGKPLLSGPVTGRNRKWSGGQDKLTVNGFDDMILLQRNLALPRNNIFPFTYRDYDVRTGKAETVMKAFLNANIGANASSERRVEITTQADTGLGFSVTGRARYHTLLELFTSLALVGGDLGFRIVQKNNALEFQVYKPTDKSKIAVFSPLQGNLLEFEYSTEDPEANYAIVGGGGEGKDRIILEKADSESISNYGRIETFLDRRDTSDTVELTQSLDEELSSKSEKMSLSITPIDTEMLAFGADYNVGDIVSVILADANDITNVQKITDVVREIKLSLNQDGSLVVPTLGTPDATSKKASGIFTRLEKFHDRISHLERR